ncbi:hypothetical protein NVP1063O_021 [Vibrio phage 1.063.O._10N.261.45.C7]|nr:hypothetical protein NVP1063O_021 [Vibrio phage 1.063.O._10N.261.45.C7]
MKKYYKKFTSKLEMITELASLTDRFDTEAMVAMIPKSGPRRLYLITPSGQQVACDNFKKFISVFSSISGLKFMSPICFGRGEVYNIFTTVDYFGTEGIKAEVVKPISEKVEVPVKVDKEEVVTDVEPDPVQEDVQDTEPTVSEDATTEGSVDVDWEWVEGLKNTKYDKIELDKYAETKFDIKLKRTNTMPNMILDFKAQLEDKA